jgi:hypothetical protein
VAAQELSGTNTETPGTPGDQEKLHNTHITNRAATNLKLERREAMVSRKRLRLRPPWTRNMHQSHNKQQQHAQLAGENLKNGGNTPILGKRREGLQPARKLNP